MQKYDIFKSSANNRYRLIIHTLTKRRINKTHLHESP